MRSLNVLPAIHYVADELIEGRPAALRRVAELAACPLCGSTPQVQWTEITAFDQPRRSYAISHMWCPTCEPGGDNA